MKAPVACPCGAADAKGRFRPYAACCGLCLDDWVGHPAPTAEALMRSRYTAFVLERVDYLQATWHASTRPPELTLEPGVKWLGLEVKSHQVTAPERAEVEFVARSRQAGRASRLHERSRFVLEQGRWYYVDGDML